MNGTYIATVDRIVDGETAVLLLEDPDSGDVFEEMTLAVGELPAAAQEDGGLLRVTVEDGEITDLEYLHEETTARRERLQDRFDDLSKRLE